MQQDGRPGVSTQGRSEATSPIVKALMMLLAEKAFQHYRFGSQGSAQGSGLGDILGCPAALVARSREGLAACCVGCSAEAACRGGLGGLLDQFRQNGYDNHVDSWVGTGPNQRLAPDELSPATLDELEQQTGLPRQQLLSELSEELPDAVDQFTPDDRLPTEQEVSSRWV